MSFHLFRSIISQNCEYSSAFAPKTPRNWCFTNVNKPNIQPSKHDNVEPSIKQHNCFPYRLCGLPPKLPTTARIFYFHPRLGRPWLPTDKEGSSMYPGMLTVAEKHEITPLTPLALWIDLRTHSLRRPNCPRRWNWSWSRTSPPSRWTAPLENGAAGKGSHFKIRAPGGKVAAKANFE